MKPKEDIWKGYIPYGKKWEKEMMKFPKKFLIGLIRDMHKKEAV